MSFKRLSDSLNNIERYDVTADQLENVKKVILNLLIQMNLDRVKENDIDYDIQNIRLLSISLTDIFKNYKKLRDMKLTSLSEDEKHYIFTNISDFFDMLEQLFK